MASSSWSKTDKTELKKVSPSTEKGAMKSLAPNKPTMHVPASLLDGGILYTIRSTGTLIVNSSPSGARKPKSTVLRDTRSQSTKYRSRVLLYFAPGKALAAAFTYSGGMKTMLVPVSRRAGWWKCFLVKMVDLHPWEVRLL